MKSAGRRTVGGQAVATNDYEKLSTSLKLTDTKTRKETVLFDAEKKRGGLRPVFAGQPVSWSRNTNRYGRDAGGELHVWDLQTLQEVKAPPMKDAVLDMAYSPDGGHLAVWDHGTGTRLFDTKTWKERPLAGRDEKRQFARFAFSPDGRMLRGRGRSEIRRHGASPRPGPARFPATEALSVRPRELRLRRE